MDVCTEKHKQIDKQFEVNAKRLNNHSERLDMIEREIVGQKKDTLHLKETLEALKKSIDRLIEEIEDLKYKPLKKYEKVMMVIFSALAGYLISKLG